MMDKKDFNFFIQKSNFTLFISPFAELPIPTACKSGGFLKKSPEKPGDYIGTANRDISQNTSHMKNSNDR